MKTFWKIFFIQVSLSSSFSNLAFSQPVFSNVDEAANYFDQNYYSIFSNSYFDKKTIEGIYTVDASFENPALLGSGCNYSNYTIKNYDKIYIVKKGNQLFQYSFEKSRFTGNFSLPDQFGQYRFKIDNINDPFRLSPVVNETVFFNDRSLSFDITVSCAKYNDIINYFGVKYYSYLKNPCPTQDEIVQLFSNCYDIVFKYTRIFPQKDYVPQPQYSYGTGFVLQGKGSLQPILTNYHVIESYYKTLAYRNKELKVIIQDPISNLKTEHNAYVLWTDSVNDLATININDTLFKGFGKVPYQFNSSGNIGQSVFTLGYPLQSVMGQNIKLSTGIITSITGINDIDNAYTLDLNINPGNSGGPLFNNSGEIIGIVNARLNDDALGVKVENVGYAIKAEKFIHAKTGVSDEPKLTSSIKDLNLEEKIQKIKPFIVIIKTRGEY